MLHAQLYGLCDDRAEQRFPAAAAAARGSPDGGIRIAMKRLSVLVSASAFVALGVGFAAQPTSVLADRENASSREPAPWVPGTDMVMSAHDTASQSLAPPR